MLLRNRLVQLFLALILAFTVGCSGGLGTPVITKQVYKINNNNVGAMTVVVLHKDVGTTKYSTEVTVTSTGTVAERVYVAALVTTYSNGQSVPDYTKLEVINGERQRLIRYGLIELTCPKYDGKYYGACHQNPSIVLRSPTP